MQKLVDVAYRQLNVQIPEKFNTFFNYIKENLKVSYDLPSYDFIGPIPRHQLSKGAISLCGGATRDLLLGSNINDLDVVIQDDIMGSNLYGRNGKFSVESDNEIHPHHIFNNDGELIYFHPIQDYLMTTDKPGSDIIIPPGMFDFTVNEIHLNKDFQWYATPLTWFDYDNRILRMSAGTLVTSQISIRAIRLAAKCHLRIETNTLKSIAYKLKTGFINEKVILQQLKKCVEDNVGDICFEWLRALGYSDIDKFGGMPELIDNIEARVSSGNYKNDEPEYSDYA